jgi:hypothetical protein
LFLSALDTRIAFSCSSGAACSYKTKIAEGTGIEMAEVIPSFANRFDVIDLVRCIAPRPLLILSATGDPYSRDADVIVEEAKPEFADCEDQLQHARFDGGHELTEERSNYIVEWVSKAAGLR